MHSPTAIKFSRINEEWAKEYDRQHPFEVEGSASELERWYKVGLEYGEKAQEWARTRLAEAKVAGQYEVGAYASCPTCGWRGPERETPEQAASDAREHDPAGYDEREQKEVAHAKIVALVQEILDRAKKPGADYAALVREVEGLEAQSIEAGVSRSSGLGSVRVLWRKAEGKQLRAELDALITEVEAADRAWEHDLENADLKKAYAEAKASFREREQTAIAMNLLSTCGRCGGSGYVAPWGTCFDCSGSGKAGYRKHEFQADPKIRARRAEKARVEHEEKETAHAQARETVEAEILAALDEAEKTWQEYEKDLYQSPDPVKNPGKEIEFRASLAGKLRKYGALTERQVEAVRRGLDREHEREEVLSHAPELAGGRREVEGTVISDKWKDGTYGRQHKMLVQMDDGNRVWGSVPKAVEDQARSTHYYDEEQRVWIEVPARVDDLRGARVRFTAEVEPSRDDVHFGFYKRPTAAEIVVEEQEEHDG